VAHTLTQWPDRNQPNAPLATNLSRSNGQTHNSQNFKVFRNELQIANNLHEAPSPGTVHVMKFFKYLLNRLSCMITHNHVACVHTILHWKIASASSRVYDVKIKIKCLILKMYLYIKRWYRIWCHTYWIGSC